MLSSNAFEQRRVRLTNGGFVYLAHHHMLQLPLVRMLRYEVTTGCAWLCAVLPTKLKLWKSPAAFCPHRPPFFPDRLFLAFLVVPKLYAGHLKFHATQQICQGPF